MFIHLVTEALFLLVFLLLILWFFSSTSSSLAGVHSWFGWLRYILFLSGCRMPARYKLFTLTVQLNCYTSTLIKSGKLSIRYSAPRRKCNFWLLFQLQVVQSLFKITLIIMLIIRQIQPPIYTCLFCGSLHMYVYISMVNVLVDRLAWQQRPKWPRQVERNGIFHFPDSKDDN